MQQVAPIDGCHRLQRKAGDGVGTISSDGSTVLLEWAGLVSRNEISQHFIVHSKPSHLIELCEQRGNRPYQSMRSVARKLGPQFHSRPEVKRAMQSGAQVCESQEGVVKQSDNLCAQPAACIDDCRRRLPGFCKATMSVSAELDSLMLRQKCALCDDHAETCHFLSWPAITTVSHTIGSEFE
jgi:hypothetical protein